MLYNPFILLALGLQLRILHHISIFCLPNLLAVLYSGKVPTYFYVPLAFGGLSLNQTALSSGPLDSLDGHSLAICCGLPQVKQLDLCSAPLSLSHSIFLIPDVRSETLLQRVDISSDTLDICLATSVNPGVLVPDCGNSFLGLRLGSVLRVEEYGLTFCLVLILLC